MFCNTKIAVNSLAEDLHRDAWPALAIHGDKSQSERDRVLDGKHSSQHNTDFKRLISMSLFCAAEFKSGRTPLLLATEVAARGLDIKDIGLVIVYDFPRQIEGNFSALRMCAALLLNNPSFGRLRASHWTHRSSWSQGRGGVITHREFCGVTLPVWFVQGLAITFFTMNDARKARALCSVLERSNQPVPDRLRSMAGETTFGGGTLCFP